jgi:hypothetical protein
MGNNLSNSIVRGFGFRIGSNMANSLMKNAAKNPVSPETAKRQWKRFGIGFIFYILINYISFKLYMGTPGSMGPGLSILFGWIPCFTFFKIKDVIDTKKSREHAYQSLLETIKDFKTDGRKLSNEDEVIAGFHASKKYPWSYVLDVQNKLERFKYLGTKYDAEDNCQEIIDRIMDGQIWLEMTEDNLIDLKDGKQPNKIERKVVKGIEHKKLIYGNVYSGQWYEFEDNKLTSYKD